MFIEENPNLVKYGEQAVGELLEKHGCLCRRKRKGTLIHKEYLSPKRIPKREEWL